ncbi:MAG: 50S ribosomal protein L5 [Ignavibacteriales bacterium]|nr:50S ribosomal protein L5 [Ignavibacteriales bacterium]
MAKKEKKQKEGQPKKGKKSDEPTYAVAPDVAIPCRLLERYKSDVRPTLMKKFEYKNVNQAPRLEKIVVNMGVGDAAQDAKVLDEAIGYLEAVTGQKASVRRSKKAISNFKLREGMTVGATVTLRRERMYEFLDRLINVTLPRVRDFRGLSDKSFDGRGNYTIGVKEQIVFPEINIDHVNRVMGMDVTIVTTAETDNEAHELLSSFGFPFRKKAS